MTLSRIFLELLLIFIWFTRLGTRAAVWLFVPTTRQTDQPGERTFLILLGALSLLWSLNRFDVPLRVGFWLSKPDLEQVVNTAIQVRGPVKPVWAGLYSVAKVESDTQNIQLNFRLKVTDHNGFFGGGTSAGFAKCPQGCDAAEFPPVYPAVNGPAYYIRLSKDWYWWEQSGGYPD